MEDGTIGRWAAVGQANACRHGAVVRLGATAMADWDTTVAGMAFANDTGASRHDVITQQAEQRMHCDLRNGAACMGTVLRGPCPSPTASPRERQGLSGWIKLLRGLPGVAAQADYGAGVLGYQASRLTIVGWRWDFRPGGAARRRLAAGFGGGRLAGVLTEFKQVKQENGAGHRRWFEDDGLELIVWHDAAGGPQGFQICYLGADRQERALTWQHGRGFTHARVDSGDTRPDKNLTPILMRDGAVPWARVQTEFAERSAELEPAMRDFVLMALERRAG